MIRMFFLGLMAPLLLAAEFTPNEAVAELKKGNMRYVEDRLEHPNRGSERRAELADKQAPFAVILTCSDSRVAPEIIFDQGMGELFVVRVAGNIAGAIELESIWYAVAVLKASTVLVLGHENCGAVLATIEGGTKNIPAIAAKIGPAVKGLKAADLEKGVKDNILSVATSLEQSPALSQFIKEGKLSIVTGYFQLKDGSVEFGLLNKAQ